jgi:CRP/FNR family cyclic AMP-dependent transcriptional regulator
MLSAIPLLSGLNSSQIESIGAHAKLRTYSKGDIIVREGELADSCFVVVSGQVKVFVNDDSECAREVIFKVLKPGDIFGELPMFDNEPRNANVAAMEDSMVRTLSYRAFWRAIEGSPDIARMVMRTMVKRLRHANRRIGTLALADIHARVSRTLLELAIMSNGKRVVGEPFTQQVLANMVGASREMVNRTLQDLVNEGLIDVQRKRITILNERELTEHQSKLITPIDYT